MRIRKDLELSCCGMTLRVLWKELAAFFQISITVGIDATYILALVLTIQGL
jgi:hypothetical protein